MNQKSLDKKKTKELDRTTEISIGELNRNKLVDKITSKELSKPKELEYVITWVMAKANGIDDYNWGQKQFEKDLRKKLELLLTQQRTELEQQKVKVVWNDVCEQIKKEARTELLEEIKTRVNTWGGFEDDGGNLCHYDSEILEWVNNLLNKKDE